MLKITIPDVEYYDEAKWEFKVLKGQTITLEHSLVSLSKWESKFKKPFLSDDAKTKEEVIEYVKCMTLTQNVPDRIYNNLSNENLKQVHDYIHDSMTATWFSEDKKSTKNREIITSEIIYYSMFANQIPIECQKWHLNRLLTLIRVFSIKNTPPKKMSQREILERNKAINDARRAKLGSRG